MRRLSHILLLCVALGVAVGYAQNSYVEQHLQDRYQGKTLLLRGFYSDDNLRYDSSGMPLRRVTPGDWTADGFVLVKDFHFSHKHLIIRAQRMGAFRAQKEFRLRLATQIKRDNQEEPVLVEIEIDLGPENSAEQFDDALSKIFLGEQDHIADLVPDYWKPCLPDGLMGKAESCRFSQELITIPGFTAAEKSSAGPRLETEQSPDVVDHVFVVGHGVSPPRQIHSREPEFSERARQARYQGTLTLGVIVNKEGAPTNIHILSPLGSGLDAQAVRAVEKWKFDPAEKDGQPVAVQIAIEVDFHLY